MTAQFGPLDHAIEDAEVDCYLVHAAGDEPNQRYLSGFDAPDAFSTVYTAGTIALLVRGLERNRAKRTSRAGEVRTPADYDYRTLAEEYGQSGATHRVLRSFLEELGIDSILVSDRFPVGIADGLRALGVGVRVDDTDAVGAVRAVKSTEEIAKIATVQRATESAMADVESMLANSTTDDDLLVLDGDPLTSERVRLAIERNLLLAGCTSEDVIVAGGEAAADPHDRGAGPLAPDESIIVDIFPRNKSTNYHADMTRTFVVGSPSPTLHDWHEHVLTARQAAFDTIGPGVPGAAVHDSVCDAFEAEGITTTRTDAGATTGFIHGTGHGLGLAVHELPRLNSMGSTPLEPGNVVTVEPGIYNPEVGGVRIEDLLVITDDGYDNLTEYHTSMVIDQ